MTQAEALTILKTGSNVFLTGEPGSGKTHTIREYIRYLRDRGIEPSVTASTGIAATHLHGMTIHAWSGVGTKSSVSKYDIDTILERERVVKRLKKATVLIIDEISMLPRGVLDAVNAILITARGNPLPFGGVQVIFVGDFFQLPPIGEHAEFAFTADAWSAANPVVCYLDEQHRHVDEALTELLSHIRTGIKTARIMNVLESRQVIPDSGHIPKLFTHNADVDSMNDATLTALPGDAKRFRMTEKGSPHHIEAIKKGCLSPAELVIKKGAAVMFTKNNPEEGFANGTLGVVEAFRRDGVPVVKTRDGKTIDVPFMEWTLEEEGKVLAKVTQLPLRLAWAITIHKSQGMSLDAAYIDLSKAFEYGQGYVALSRIRTIEGLYLVGFNERALEVHPLVRDTDAVVKEESHQARRMFMSMSKEEIDTLHMRSITAMGGTVGLSPQKSKKKLSTAEETLQLLRTGKTPAEIAKARGMTVRTIIGHLDALNKKGALLAADIATLSALFDADDLAHIHSAFKKLGTEKLTPVYTHLKEVYDFDTLSLARATYTG